MALSLGGLALVLAGCILVLLGVGVWIVRPRSAAARFLGAFCVGAGAAHVITPMIDASYGGATYGTFDSGWGILIVPTSLQVIGMIGLALAVPSVVDRTARGALIFAGVVATIGAAHGFITFAPLNAALPLLSIVAGHWALFFVFLMLPLRAAFASEQDVAARRTFRLMAIGLALHIGGQGGDLLRGARTGEFVAAEIVYTGILVLASPLWLRAARGPDAIAARNVALVIPAAMLVGMLVGELDRAAYYAPGSVASALVLAYAVMRGQIEGLDLKVRFALSKSTIAAVFIAVFFIASEAAQQFFGATFQSAYVGIAAAGMLVFAIAPLQRAAERLAEKAVPVAATAPPAPPGTSATDRREEIFLKAARLAIRGGISRDEEVHLAELAEELGIGAGRAAGLLRQVEREARAGVA